MPKTSGKPTPFRKTKTTRKHKPREELNTRPAPSPLRYLRFLMFKSNPKTLKQEITEVTASRNQDPIPLHSIRNPQSKIQNLKPPPSPTNPAHGHIGKCVHRDISGNEWFFSVPALRPIFFGPNPLSRKTLQPPFN